MPLWKKWSWRCKRSKDYYDAQCRIDTTEIAHTSKLVYATVGMAPPRNKPIVGANAFAHEAGIHQHGVLAHRNTYEIMSPASIGLIHGQRTGFGQAQRPPRV